MKVRVYKERVRIDYDIFEDAEVKIVLENEKVAFLKEKVVIVAEEANVTFVYTIRITYFQPSGNY